MEEQIFQPRTDLTALNNAVLSIRNEIKKIIVGQDEMVKLIIAALLADGHVLIEGVPGVAKTLTAKLVAKSVNAGFPAYNLRLTLCLPMYWVPRYSIQEKQVLNLKKVRSSAI